MLRRGIIAEQISAILHYMLTKCGFGKVVKETWSAFTTMSSSQIFSLFHPLKIKKAVIDHEGRILPF